MKKVILSAVAMSLSLGIAVAQDKPATQKTQPATDPVIIKFGTTEIRQSEFESAVKTLPAEYQAMAQGPAKKSFAEEYVRMKMLAVDAQKQGLDKDPEVQAQLRLVRDNTLANAALTKMQESIKVSDADVQKAYDEQKASMERVKARHILIAPKGSQAAQPGKKELTDEEAKAKAESIRAQILKGADFAALAQKESDDTASGARGGDLGEFGRGDMVPEFDEAVFAGKVGEVLPLIKTQYGYHIVKLEDRKAPAIADVRPQIESRLKQTMMQQRLDAMKNAQAISYDEKFFAVEAPAAQAPGAPAPAAPANPADEKKSDAPAKKP